MDDGRESVTIVPRALDWTRWLRASAIAALWAIGAIVAVMVVLTSLAEGASWRSLARELVWAIPLYLLISVPLTLLLSVLGHFLLIGLRWSHPAAFVLLGAALGALAGFLATLGTNPGALIISCAAAGAAAGWGYHRAYHPPAA
jgi:hypothetical protein